MANATIATSTENSTVLLRGLTEGNLSAGEAMQFTVMIGQFLNTWSVMFDLYREKQLPESQWIVVRTDIRAIFGDGGGLTFWREVGHRNVSPEFAACVDEILAADEQGYTFVRQR